MTSSEGYLIQLLLPLRDNEGRLFPERIWTTLKDKLTARFGGVTAYNRAPAEGTWKPTPDRVAADDVFVVEVMTQELEMAWWRALRRELEAALEQDEIVIRAWPYVSL